MFDRVLTKHVYGSVLQSGISENSLKFAAKYLSEFESVSSQYLALQNGNYHVYFAWILKNTLGRYLWNLP